MSAPDCLVVVAVPSLAVDPQTAVPVLPGPPTAAHRQMEGTSGLLGYRLVARLVYIRSDL